MAMEVKPSDVQRYEKRNRIVSLLPEFLNVKTPSESSLRKYNQRYLVSGPYLLG